MKTVKIIASKLSGYALFKAAAFMVFLGTTAVNLCAVPIWHNEPEMPQSMLNEIIIRK